MIQANAPSALPDSTWSVAGAVPVVREEVCSRSMLRRVAAMLDLDPDAMDDQQRLPRGWHFVLMAGDTRRSALRSDGFPGLGVSLPDLGLPRLMLGARTVHWHHDIPVGAPVTRRSAVQSLQRKETARGVMAVVTLAHTLHLADVPEAALVETQTYLLMPARTAGGAPAAEAPAMTGATRGAAHVKTVVPDATLLFQYSALGFNSHRIHLDRTHAQVVEGFPDLVVNGGLATLLLTEFLRCELSLRPVHYAVRHTAPLYCGRPLTLAATRLGDPGRWQLQALDEQQRLAVDMEVSVA